MGDRTKQKLAEFAQLEVGWRYGEGIPFSEKALATAAWVEGLADSVENIKTDVFPAADGSIFFCFYLFARNYLAEYLIKADGSWEFLGNEKIKENEN